MQFTPRARNLLRVVSVWIVVAVVVAASTYISDPKLSRASAIAGVVLVLWLTELIPLYATTFILWAAVALALGPLDPRAFSLSGVLSSAANPILLLFFAGFVLSAAGTRHGIDRYVASWIVRLSGGHRRVLLFAIMLGAAVLSMWMSNIAAAAMMVATLRPLLAREEASGSLSFRTALLLGIAFAADFGGMGTPIGTGPNMVAIAELSKQRPVSFLQWMVFGVPAALLMVFLAFLLLVFLHRVKGRMTIEGFSHESLTRKGWAVVVIFFLSVGGWMLEPVLGIPAPIVGLAAAATFFGTGLLDRSDLTHIEWDTLLLVAGGLSFGYMVEASGLASTIAQSVNWGSVPPALTLLAMLTGCALLSAIASNTAAAAIVIPIAATVVPGASVPVLVALSASMGVPFVISTPPNAVVYGQGGLRARDLFIPGAILLLAGCALLMLFGPALLRVAKMN